jgi:hypothetical protein
MAIPTSGVTEMARSGCGAAADDDREIRTAGLRMPQSKKAGIRKGAGLKSLKHPALPPNISEGNG